MVDELIGKQEVVIKSLGETLRNVAGSGRRRNPGRRPRRSRSLDLDGRFRDGGAMRERPRAMGDGRALSRQEFEQDPCDWRYTKFGLDLQAGKEELVSARLGTHGAAVGFRPFRSTDARPRRLDRRGAGRNDRCAGDEFHVLSSASRSISSSCRDRAARVRYRARSRSGARPAPSGEEVWIAPDAGGARRAGLREVRFACSRHFTGCCEIARRGIYPADRCRCASGARDPAQYFDYAASSAGKGGIRSFPKPREMLEFRRINLIEPLSWGTAGSR